MDIFFTADTHFFHNGILRHCERPWGSVEEMDEALIKNYNSVVPRKNSLVYILGDFAWKRHLNYLNRLNGKKILITGSHDRMSNDVMSNFTDVYKNSWMISLNGERIFVSHCCHRVWETGHYGTPHLFGHSHGRLKTFNLSFDVGVDTELANYFPIPLENIKKEINRREEIMMEQGRIVDENGKKLYRQDDVFWLNSQLNIGEENG